MPDDTAKDRRSIVLSGPKGHRITTLKEWEVNAPPKKRALHWKDYRSAKENAQAWLRDGQRMPEDLFRLLESRPETRAFRYTMAYPENIIQLDACGPEQRNSDITVHGEQDARTILIDVEAKADEPFGSQTIAEALAAGRSKPRSFVPTRIAMLCKAVFGRDVDEKIGSLRYQLLYSLAAPVLEAQRTKASICALIIHEFHSATLKPKKVAANAAALQAFIGAIESWENQKIEPGALLPPITLPGYSVPVTLGKVRTELP